MRIRLLGPPHVSGVPAAPPVRGHQAWAVLARVLLSDRPLARRELAGELFPDTSDPLGSLRWCLAAIRRACAAPSFMTGDPVRADLSADMTVDVLDLLAGRFDPAEVGDLLEGIEPRCAPELDLWLLVQRQRVAGQIDAFLRREVMTASAADDVDRALSLAEVAARRQPLDEGAQILLVATLRQAGRLDAATAVVASVEERFARELGVAPSPGLRSAARPHVSSPPPGVPARSRALALLEAGKAALAAAAVDAGIESLRQAAKVAEECKDDQVLGRCLLGLGSALVHAVRSHDDEGAMLLQRAAALAEGVGDSATAAGALRELGYVDAMAGRRPAAELHLQHAEALIGDDPDVLASVLSVRAFNLADWGRHELALREWSIALDVARSSGNVRRLAWALGLGAWGSLRAGDLDSARGRAQECLDVVGSSGWISFRPWPVAVLAEAHLRSGDTTPPLDVHREFALSCQLSDPCWEGGTARVLALQELAAGRPHAARTWVDEAARRVCRETDVYVAAQAAVLSTDIDVSTELGDRDRVGASARALLELAARGHMDDHLERATVLLQRL